ncbi:L-lactate dehydrogenase [Labedella populi]|uniref:L-lactate dehydrogenase n=1 Tax=Labedella populi TaxID=2498850 RepID=A0A3S4AJ51_9MICO|nr:L-lactate dehydrogenase [Labedella populi]RWZ61234.1 L-lactate dehydrogenase [Labedella populi]
MAVIENSKLAIIGAGSVGASLAYAALIRSSARTIALYDVDTRKVDAEVLDLAHGTQFTGHSRIIGGDDVSVLAGAHVVVITAGAKQRPGQTRLDLAASNVALLERILPAAIEQAPDAVFILVTNPCDVLTVVARRISGLPAERVFASGTVLDTSRLRWLLAEAAGVATSSVHAYIVGEHGDSEFPLWSTARIGATPLTEWRVEDRIVFSPGRLDEITDQVKNAAYRVIEGKGATNYAIGLSAARIVEAILRDENTILPVSSVLDGFHGIDGVALSIPSIVGAGGVGPVLDVATTPEEERLLHSSAEAISASDRSLGFSR